MAIEAKVVCDHKPGAMRLLHYDSAGEICLNEYFDIPPYAILSHTWGYDEVTFKDLINGQGKKKAGYSKIQFCGEQATRDGLRYFWVDTCCIDKSSSAELSEAINLMFRWFQSAAKCYVYLTDVSTPTINADVKSSEQSWKQAFRFSKWFTRAWTLQELLAPASVEFFSHEGQRLGDKSSLMQLIHEITGIPVLALQGAPLSEFSVDERMSWLSTRRTTRSEDKAYSVMGISMSVCLFFTAREKNAHSNGFKRRLPKTLCYRQRRSLSQLKIQEARVLLLLTKLRAYSQIAEYQ